MEELSASDLLPLVGHLGGSGDWGLPTKITMSGAVTGTIKVENFTATVSKECRYDGSPDRRIQQCLDVYVGSLVVGLEDVSMIKALLSSVKTGISKENAWANAPTMDWLIEVEGGLDLKLTGVVCTQVSFSNDTTIGFSWMAKGLDV